MTLMARRMYMHFFLSEMIFLKGFSAHVTAFSVTSRALKSGDSTDMYIYQILYPWVFFRDASVAFIDWPMWMFISLLWLRKNGMSLSSQQILSRCWDFCLRRYSDRYGSVSIAYYYSHSRVKDNPQSVILPWMVVVLANPNRGAIHFCRHYRSQLNVGSSKLYQ